MAERFEKILMTVRDENGIHVDTVAKGTLVTSPGRLELTGKNRSVTLSGIREISKGRSLLGWAVRVEFDPDAVSVSVQGGRLKQFMDVTEYNLRRSLIDHRALARVLILVEEMPAGDPNQFIHTLLNELKTSDGQPYSDFMGPETEITLERRPDTGLVANESSATAAANAVWGEAGARGTIGFQRFSGGAGTGTTVELWGGELVGTVFLSFAGLRQKERTAALEAALQEWRLENLGLVGADG